MPGVLLSLFFRLAVSQITTEIFRYPSYTGCNAVAGTVSFKPTGDAQQMVVSLQSLPPNATGFIQVRNGVNCFDPFQIGGSWRGESEMAYPFEANENGVANGTIPYGNVTIDSLMGRSVIIVIENENSTTRIGCGNVGLNYPTTLVAYPGVAGKVQGSIAVTGPLSSQFFSSTNSGPTMVQLVFAMTGLAASSSGTIQVYSGATCRNVSGVGSVWGGNWTSKYTADAAGVAIGNADITNVSPRRGVGDYMNHAVVIHDANNNPIACGVLACPASSIEQGQTGGMNMQHGKCVPSTTWISSTVVAGDFFSLSNPVQVQVSGVGFDLNYGDVRSYPACAPQGQSVTATYFLQQSGGTVQAVQAGVFQPVLGVKQVVVLGDKQPESVGRTDNSVVMNFPQSTEANAHDVVNLAVGVEAIMFHVGSSGHRSEIRLEHNTHAKIAFPTSENPVNTTVWVTNAANNAVIFQKEYLFGKYSPNFVWFVHGWDSLSPDCKGLKNCKLTPLSVTSWPIVRGDYGKGVIPNVTQYASASMSLPSLALLTVVIALF